MAVADITALIRPPVVPEQVGTLAEWQTVERELGVTFPADFREYVITYGTGYLGRFYSVWNPYRGSEFVEQVQLICGYELDARQQFPQYVPYPSYPDSPGFLPWGSDDNGNYYGWLTDGVPDRWPVLTNEVRGHGMILYRRTMTEYLAGVFRGEIRPLAGGYPTAEDLVFRALSPDLPDSSPRSGGGR